MSVKILDVEKKSVSEKKGVKPGDELLTVNGNEVFDRLDYSFYGSEENPVIEFRNAKGKVKKKCLRGCPDIEQSGLCFETYLMEKQHSCLNKCIFCFIDQMPPGMRESLYFKDDDSRLSFLFGNYITLTNLSRRDADRIKKMHISPVNVSVHTMNPELRVKMMKNKHSGEVLSYLREFSDAGIKINAQLVLCPGINDGDELLFSLEELAKLENVESIAAVPVGLTKFREGLHTLKAYDKQSSAEVIDIIENFNRRFTDAGRKPLAFASDEFYLTAGREFPPFEYYGDFLQLDNGVGMWVSSLYDFRAYLKPCEDDGVSRRFALATGVLAAPLMQKCADMFCKVYPNTDVKIFPIKNKFFGESVTVAGLVTGGDLIASLKESNFDYPILIIPKVMIKSNEERIFLDDVTVEQVEKELSTRVIISGTSGDETAAAFEQSV